MTFDGSFIVLSINKDATKIPKIIIFEVNFNPEHAPKRNPEHNMYKFLFSKSDLNNTFK